ncbi:MAG: HAMP domain-containing histidine kinase [Actinomycetota bacterium]|nr:HAMP domain-containing histidine kinase [Actinomycetota bacterium]
MRTPLARLPRPLDPLRSFKAKVALLVGLSLLASTLVFWAASDWPLRYSLLIAVVVAVVVTQLLAHGMTSPLREMTRAARAMARGKYDTRVRATSRDEIGELAVAFNQMSADLAAADLQRRELLANVSHELRTPISALQAVLENLVDGVADPDPETWTTALRQTERLGRLVAELLDLARLDGGALELDRTLFAVRPFLDEAVGQAGVTATVDVEPPDLVACADTARLHQVVANLLDNAARHGPPGGEVVVRARGTEDGLQLDVIDRGPGIALSERSRVFERFHRGGTVAGGTGLGLAIAKWAVEMHGGAIAVVGDQSGCLIRVTLPSLET